MALQRSLTQRLLKISKTANPSLTNCRISTSPAAVKSAAFNNQEAPKKYAHDPGDDSLFRRCFHRMSESAVLPKFRFFPDGERLLEGLRGMDVVKERIRISEVRPPPEDAPEGKVTLADAKKVLLVSQIEAVKSRLRQIEKGVVSYSEFLQICVQESTSADQGMGFAKLLDESGAVLVLGNTVFLWPEQVVNAIQGLIPLPSACKPNDSSWRELQELEHQKAAIDKKAKEQVQKELWCGLGCLLFQTAAFMRLTFWELTWDVMEPICFYVTSIYFIGGYAFFLRTSKEPTFEGVFKSRFSSKQRKLMKLHNFDMERYNKLKKACEPDSRLPRYDPLLCTSDS